jgi:hypothetical protein
MLSWLHESTHDALIAMPLAQLIRSAPSPCPRSISRPNSSRRFRYDEAPAHPEAI